MAKNILIGLAVLVALVVGAVIVAPSFIDSQALKQEITTQARAATGRDLTIDGNLEIRVFPSPSMTAHNVRLSNAEGGEAQHMVDMQAVEVRVALAPLLSGQVQVEKIRLVSPKVTIEKYADGASNLDMRPQAQQAPQSPSSGQTQSGVQNAGADGSDMDIRLDNFEIVDGRVVYADMASGAREVVEGIDATLRAASLNGPFEVLGAARVRGVPLAYEASVGQIIKERTVPLNAEIKASAGTKLQLSGGIFDLASTPHFKGSIHGSGDNLAKLLDSILGKGTAPVQLSQTFGLETQVDASAEGLDLADLEIQLGASRMTGAVKADMSKGVSFNVDLKSAHLNLDAIGGEDAPQQSMTQKVSDANASAQPDIAPSPPKVAETSAAAAKAFAFPSDMAGKVQLHIDAITLKGDIISDFQISAELADGELTLSQFQAIAPGVTELAVFGFVAPQDGLPQFQGTVEVTSADPQTLTKWIGVQLPPEVAGRVKRVSYSSKVAADPKQVVVSDLKVQADKSTLSGGVTLAVRDRLSFGADLTLDTINLDTYLNGGSHTPATQTVESGAASSPTQKASATKPESTSPVANITQALSVFSALNDFDANMKFRINSLTHQGQVLKNFMFDGTLYSGALDLRALSVGSYLGARGQVSGKFAGFGGIPELNNVKIAANVKDLSALTASLAVKGVPPGVKNISLNSTLNGSFLKPKLDSQVKVLGGTVATQGQVFLLPLGFGYEGTLSTQFKDLAAVLKGLDIDYDPKGPLGALKLTSKVKTDGKTHTLSGIQSTLGDTSINGDVSANTAGEKPRVTADLQTGGLVVDRFMPREQKNAGLHEPQSRFGKVAARQENVVFASFGAEQLAAVDKRWSTEEFDLSVLNTLDADVTLKSQFIQFGDYKLDDADIHATVDKGVMEADRLRGILFGGPVSGTATVRANGTPTIETNISVDALKISQAVKAVTGQNLADGAMSLGLNFNASGLSPAGLVSSLAGNGSLDINALDVKQKGKGSALSGVIGLVSAMNQLSLSSKKGKGMADVSMAFDIQDGVATAKTLSLNSAMGSGSGSGTVDIAGWGIDVSGNMTVEPNLLTSLISKGRIGRQEVPFSLKGALDNPGVKLAVAPASSGGGTGTKLDPFKSLIEKAVPGVKLPTQKKTAPTQNSDGTLAPPPPQSGSSNDNQKIDPAKELLKGLLRGL